LKTATGANQKELNLIVYFTVNLQL